MCALKRGGVSRSKAELLKYLAVFQGTRGRKRAHMVRPQLHRIAAFPSEPHIDRQIQRLSKGGHFQLTVTPSAVDVAVRRIKCVRTNDSQGEQRLSSRRATMPTHTHRYPALMAAVTASRTCPGLQKGSRASNIVSPPVHKR